MTSNATLSFPVKQTRRRSLTSLALVSALALAACDSEADSTDPVPMTPASPDAGTTDPTPTNPGPGDAATTDPEPVIEPAQPPPGFTSRRAAVNDIELHYVIGGSGTPVVLLHGWPQTWYEYHRIMPALAERHTVIVPDLRGGGESDKPVMEGGYTKHLLASDIHELVRSLGYSEIILVGHDIGGMVAYAYAVDYPEELKGLVIMDVPLPGIEPMWSEILKHPLSWHFDFHAEADISVPLVEGHVREYITSFYRKFGANPNAFTEQEINEFTRAYSAPGALAGGFAWYASFPQDAADNQISQATKLTMPVLALGGQYSAGEGVLFTLQAVAENVRGGSIAGAGHWLTEEAPEALTTELLTFFQEIERAK